MNEQTTVIIPALNEAPRISDVLKPLIRARKKGVIHDIVVVDGGSKDDTIKIVSKFDVKIVKLKNKKGKGAALLAGVEVAETEILVFLDADLVGLKESHLQSLLAPIVNNEKIGMVSGILKTKGVRHTIGNKARTFAGPKALRKSWAEEVVGLDESGHGADYLVSAHSKRENIKVMKIYLHHLRQVYRKKKRHFIVGSVAHRTKTYYDIAKTWKSSVKQ